MFEDRPWKKAPNTLRLTVRGIQFARTLNADSTHKIKQAHRRLFLSTKHTRDFGGTQHTAPLTTQLIPTCSGRLFALLTASFLLKEISPPMKAGTKACTCLLTTARACICLKRTTTSIVWLANPPAEVTVHILMS